MKTATDIQAFFLSATPQSRISLLEACPATIRQSTAMSLARLDDVACGVQALEMVAEDLVNAAHLPEGTQMAEAAHRAARQLFEAGQEPQDALLQVSTRSAISWMNGLLKESRFDEVFSSAQAVITWLDSLSSISQPVLENRESLRLKLVETYVDAGLYEEAKSQLAKVDEAGVSSIMTITRDSLRTRINMHLKEPDSEPASLQEGDVQTVLQQLRAAQPLVGPFEQMGMIAKGTSAKLEELIRNLETAGSYDAQFAAEINSILGELTSLTSRDPNVR